MIKTLGVLVLAATFSALPTTAMAIPITGSIGFTGSIADVINWQTVNSITFLSAETECPGATCTGTYGAVADAVPVAFTSPWNFTAQPNNNLWSFNPGGFAFDLLAVQSITRVGTTESGGLVILGTGTLRATGFDNTPGTFSFSANSTQTEFRFGATNEAIVPDGGSTLGLLGLGLLGLSSLRRRFLNR